MATVPLLDRSEDGMSTLTLAEVIAQAKKDNVRTRISNVFHAGNLAAKVRALDAMNESIKLAMNTLYQQCFNPTTSSLWACLMALQKFHWQARSCNDDFQREMFVCLDNAVRHSIGETFIDGNGKENSSPWTNRGHALTAEYTEHLKRLSLPIEPPLPGGCENVFQGLDRIRKATHKLAGIREQMEETELKELKEKCEKHILGSRDAKWWKESPFARAFAIGVKDLLKNLDTKGLLHVINAAKRPVEAPRDSPFGWTEPLMTLGGDFIVRFAGDSDSIQTFAEKLKKVQDQVLPAFLMELARLRSAYVGWIEWANQIKAALLGAFVATGPSAFRYLTGSDSSTGTGSQ